MKLGDKVSFDKHITKNKNLTYEEVVKDIKYGTIALGKTLNGIVCGVRAIGYKGYWDSECDDYGNEASSWYKITETKKVYLVATKLNHFYYVPIDWIIN